MDEDEVPVDDQFEEMTSSSDDDDDDGAEGEKVEKNDENFRFQIEIFNFFSWTLRKNRRKFEKNNVKLKNEPNKSC